MNMLFIAHTQLFLGAFFLMTILAQSWPPHYHLTSFSRYNVKLMQSIGKRTCKLFLTKNSCERGLCIFFLIFPLILWIVMATSPNSYLDDSISRLNDLKSKTPAQCACNTICTYQYPKQINITKCCDNYFLDMCRQKDQCYNQTVAKYQQIVDSQSGQDDITIYIIIGSFACGLILSIRQIWLWRKAKKDALLELIYQIGNNYNSGIGSFLIEDQPQPQPPPRIALHHQSYVHVDQQNQCAICLQSFNNEKVIKLLCKHVFHSNCCRDWLAENPTCPVCRAPN